MKTHSVDDITLEESHPEGLALLKRWLEQRTDLWVYLAATNAGLASVMQAHVEEVSLCLVFRNEATVVRLDIENARFRYAPLQALMTPTDLGLVVAISQKSDGLLGHCGLHISLESGHKVFVCESQKARNWLEFASMLLAPRSGGLLES